MRKLRACLLLLGLIAIDACKKDKVKEETEDPVVPDVFRIKSITQATLPEPTQTHTTDFVYEAGKLMKIANTPFVNGKPGAISTVDIVYKNDRVDKRITFQGGVFPREYTEQFNYDGSGRVNHIDYIPKYKDLPDGSKVPNGDVEYSEIFTYNAAGKMTMLDKFYPLIGTPPITVHYRTAFEYDAQGLLKKAIAYTNDDPGNGTYILFESFTEPISIDPWAITYPLEFNMHPILLTQVGRLPKAMKLYYTKDDVDHQSWDYVYTFTDKKLINIQVSYRYYPNYPFLSTVDIAYE
ncbi:hypothetical protein GCM10023149_10170 [Mucilaginibacter gynuensis]|uniref:YD repeat-containing protein n=1 Tax=Mucilaginibacter gynuensis TaxID=1302236 RepID=A0ABP8FZD5_9SPHI